MVTTAVVRFGGGPAAKPDTWLATVPAMTGSLVPVAPCGQPFALGCRRLWRLGYQRGAWLAGTGLGAVTVAASLLAGQLGSVAIALYAVTSARRCG